MRVAAELRQPDAELGERLLRRVAGVLRVAEEMARQPLDPGRVAGTQRLERKSVARLCARDENRIAQPLVVERPLRTQRLADRLHSAD